MGAAHSGYMGVTNPGMVRPMLASTAIEAATTAGLYWGADMPLDKAMMIGNLAGMAGGAVAGRGQIGEAPMSVRKILHAERVARAEYEGARLAALGAEFEASKGIQISDGVTLFKSMPANARFSSEAANVRALLDAPEIQAGIVYSQTARISGTTPAVPGRDYFVAGMSEPTLHYEGGGLYHPTDKLFSGGFEPQLRTMANMTNMNGGFIGGSSPVEPPIYDLTVRFRQPMIPRYAQFNRFNIEWAQSERGYLTIGARNPLDSALRGISRDYMDSIGFVRGGLDAGHVLDSIINPWIQTGAPGTVYYYGDMFTHRSFGGQLGYQKKILNLRLGDRVRIGFEGFPDYDVVRPEAPPASPPNLL